MKRILCTGDSHTWGQGAPGLWEQFDPPPVAGDLRLAGFEADSYVNLLRRRLAQQTDARYDSWRAPQLATLGPVGQKPPCVLVGERPLVLPFTGAVLRLEYARGEAPCRWTATVDGILMADWAEPCAAGPNDYRLCTLHLNEGPHILRLRAVQGVLPLFCVESYSGGYAVINSGVGSAPTFSYRERYWQDHVAAVRPDIVLAEAHTINDWLAGDPPRLYRERLTALLQAYHALGAQVLLLTVTPVQGAQTFGQNPVPYEAYVQASREAAALCGVPVCDVNAVLGRCLAGVSTQQAMRDWYDDPWHPNARGHALYAELLYQALCQHNWL